MRFFVVSYTNRVKDYCEAEFFERFNEIAMGHLTLVVDNTPGREYFEHLVHLTPYVAHIDIDRQPEGSLFQRNVAESVAFCRQKFLESNCDVMVIIESDVLPPVDLLRRFEIDIDNLSYSEDVDKACGIEPRHKWGIIGGLYYTGFHDYSLTDCQRTGHVLSGCTAYRRELVEKYPFRYDPANLGAFPDALICADAGGEYELFNDHNIICKHLELQPGCRQSSSL